VHMTTKVVPGLLIATPDAESCAREASSRMAKAIRDAQKTRGKAAIALSGGETPRAAYAHLAHEERIDWTKVDVFFVDERAVPPKDDRSNFRWAKETLLDPAKVPVENIHRMPGESKDLEAAARDYEKLLRAKLEAPAPEVPSLDLLVMGIGEDGHTASLFPGDPAVDIIDRLVAAVPGTSKREARLTITVPTIEAARVCVVIAVGKGKQHPLEKIWAASGDVHQTPARVIRGVRGSISWIIDKRAGGLG
jgi:6-phosphogluconolactonase